MQKSDLISLLTRLYLCKQNKVESIKVWNQTKDSFMNLSEPDLETFFIEYGLSQKEAS